MGRTNKNSEKYQANHICFHLDSATWDTDVFTKLPTASVCIIQQFLQCKIHKIFWKQELVHCQSYV